MRLIALSTLKSFWEATPAFQEVKESKMIWRLHRDLGIPAESLIRPSSRPEA